MKLINCFFVVPLEHFNTVTGDFNLIPDNGDVLPIDIIHGSVVWSGFIYNPKIAKFDNEGTNIGREAVLVKTFLDQETIMHIKTQTTEFMSLEVYEEIEKISPSIGEIIAEEAANNLTMNTVTELMISHTYAGRNLTEVVWLWPELAGKIHDITTWESL